MALQIGSGEITITSAGGTGSKTYAHGLSFTPELILWFGNGLAAGNTLDGDGQWMFGASKDSTHEMCVCGWSDDNNASNNVTGQSTNNNASIAFQLSHNGYDMLADFTSVDGTNFTLNVSNAPAADKTIQFVAIAGTALSIDVGTFTIATGTNEQTVTGVGFTPKLLLFATAGFQGGAVNTAIAQVLFSLGACSAIGAEWTIANSDQDGVGTSVAKSLFTTGSGFYHFVAAGTAGGAFNVTSLDADGFKVTPSVSFGGNMPIGYIAIGGANFSAHAGVGTILAAAAVGAKAYTGTGFKPQLLLTAASICTVDATITAGARLGIGVAHGASNRATSVTSNDGAATSATSDGAIATKNIYVLAGGLTTTRYDASLTSFDANGFTEDITTNVAGSEIFGYIAMRENAAPVITSNGGGATAAINSAENQTAVTTVVATDADSDTIAYSKSGTDAAFFDINSSSGVLTWHAAPNFEVKADGDADGVYLVTVTASDGVLTDTQDLSVTVTNVNEAPVITSNGGGATASINVAENTTAVTTVTATDVDAATTLTYSISAGADSALFGIDSTTGVLAFLDAPDYESPADADTDNDYLVTVQVSDGALTDTQALTITVTDVDETPPGAAAGTMRLGIDIGITL